MRMGGGLLAATAVVASCVAAPLTTRPSPVAAADPTEPLITDGPLELVADIGGALWGLSADERYALTGVPGTPRRVELATGATESVPITFSSDYDFDYPIAFAADGRSVVVSSPKGLAAADDGDAGNTTDLFSWSFDTDSWTLLTPEPAFLPFFEVEQVSADGTVAILTKKIQEFGPVELYRYDLVADALVRVDTAGAQPSEPQFSADAGIIAYHEAQHGFVYRAADGARIQLDTAIPDRPPGRTSGGPTVSANGRFVSFTVAGGGLPDAGYTRDLATGEIWSAGAKAGLVSDDGQRVLFSAPGPSGASPHESFAYVADHRDGGGDVSELVSAVDGVPFASKVVRFGPAARSALVLIGNRLHRRPLREESLPPVPDGGGDVPLGEVASGPVENLYPGSSLLRSTADGRFLSITGWRGGATLVDRTSGPLDVALLATSELYSSGGGLVFSTTERLLPEDDDSVEDAYRYWPTANTFELLTGGLEDEDWAVTGATPDGARLLLYAMPSWELRSHTYLFTPATGELKPLGDDTPGAATGINTGPRNATVSNDGRYFVYEYVDNAGGCYRCQHVWLYDAVGERYVPVDRGRGGSEAWGDAASPIVSADGSTIVFRSNAFNLDADVPPTDGWGIYRFDVATGVITRVSASGADVSVSADGRRIAYHDDDRVWVYDWRDGSAKRQLITEHDDVPAFGRGGHVNLAGDEVLFESFMMLPSDNPALGSSSTYRRPLTSTGTPTFPTSARLPTCLTVPPPTATPEVPTPISDGPIRPVRAGAYWGSGFSADGRFLLEGVPDRPVRTDLTDGSWQAIPVRLPSESSPAQYPIVLTPGGESVVVSSTNGLTADDDGDAAATTDLFRWTFGTQSWQLLTPGDAPLLSAYRLVGASTDADEVLVTTAPTPYGPRNLYVVDLATQSTRLLSSSVVANTPIRLSLDGRTALVTEATHVAALDVASGGRTVLDRDAAGQPADGVASAPYISANGRFVAFQSTATNIAASSRAGAYVTDLQTGAIWPAGAASGPVSDDGQRVLSMRGGQAVPSAPGLHVHDRRGGTAPVEELVGMDGGHPIAVQPVWLRPDGRMVRFAATGHALADGSWVPSCIYERSLRAVSYPPTPPVPLAPIGVVTDAPIENILPGVPLGFVSQDGRYVSTGFGVRDRVTGMAIPGVTRVNGGLFNSEAGLFIASDSVTSGSGGSEGVWLYDPATGLVSDLRATLPSSTWQLIGAAADGDDLLLFERGTSWRPARTVVWTRSTGVVREVGPGTPGPTSTGGSPTAARNASISADGRRVAYLWADHAWLLDLDTDGLTAIDRAVVPGNVAFGPASDPAIAADGSAVVFRSGAFDLDADAPPAGTVGVYRFDVATGDITRISDTGGRPMISGDGDRIAYSGDSRTVWVYDRLAASGPVRQQVVAPNLVSYPSGVAPDVVLPTSGRELLFEGARVLASDEPVWNTSVYRIALPATGGESEPPPTTTTTSTTSTTTSTTSTTTTSTTTTTTVAPGGGSSSSSTSSSSTSSSSTSSSSTSSSSTSSSSTSSPGTSTSTTAAPSTTAPPTTVPPIVEPPPPAAPGFAPLVPARVLDTRAGGTTADGMFQGLGALAPGETLRLRLAGRGGVAADAPSVALNLTATGATTGGYVTVWPCDGPAPNASNVNVAAGGTVANLVVTGLDGEGFACLRAGDTRVHLLADVAATSAVYQPLVPSRLLDQRPGATTADGAGAGGGAVRAGATVTVRVAGRGGVPGQVAAVALNVTATDAAAAGYVTVWPCGEPPLASSVNLIGGATAANLVIVPTSAAGDVCVRTMESEAALIVDVQGYVPLGAGVVPHTPARLLDTRPGAPTADGAGAGIGMVAAGTTVELDVAGRLGVPEGAAAVIVNVTATEPAGPGYVTVWPCGPAPNASTLNVTAGTTVANAALVGLGDGGRICLRPSETSSHLIVDLAGHITS